MRILSFDASTTTVGVSLLAQELGQPINLEYSDFFKPPKDGELFARFKAVKDFVIELIDKLNPDEIVIEDFIPFMKASNSKTIILLATFNRMVGMAIYEKTGKSPKMINVLALRHALKLSPELPSKDQIPELVAHHLDTNFPYVYITGGKKKGQISEESYDIADAVALGLGYLIKPELAIKKEKKPKKRKSTKKKTKKAIKKKGSKKKK